MCEHAASITCTTRVLAHLLEASVSLSRNSNMIKSIGFAGALAAFLLAPACTDLTEVPQSSITPDHFYRNEAEATGGLASVYASLRDFANGYYEATEVT